MNISKLKGKMRECNATYAEVAKSLGLSVASFSNKMNGKSKFYINEIEILGNCLGLSDSEKIDIFLS